MNAEIIAVGTELLLGQIVNTNAAFLSRRLAAIGIHVYYQTVVGDNGDRLRAAVELAKSRADILIFTGGLGPTKDDLTKETIAAVLGTELVYDEKALQYIQEYFARTGRTFTENNKKQALVFAGSTIFPNDHGMAPGIGLRQDGKLYILLPGPPKEMNPMFLTYTEPFLQSLFSAESLHSRVLRFFGIGESQLEHTIEDLIDAQTNPTIAPLASEGEVTLRLTAKHGSAAAAKALLDELEAEISARVGAYLYGYDDDSLQAKAVALLRQKSLTLACAESFTGGMFGERLTEVAGVSAVFHGGVICYSNEVKRQLLGVSEEVLLSHGAASEECAKLLAEGVCALLGATAGISFTGAAGPDGLDGKPPGTVYLGIAIQGRPTAVIELQLAGTRQMVRERAVKYGLYHIIKKLEEL